MATGYETYLKRPLRPSIDWTEHGLYRITRRWEVDSAAAKAANIESKLFLPRETADEEFPQALLVDQGISEGTPFGVDQMYYRVYQELPEGDATLVQLGTDVISYSDNGLKMVEQRFVARDGHTLTGTVGTTTGTSGDINGLYLSGNGFAERGKVSAIVVKRWAEAGIIAMPEQPGSLRLPGTRMITLTSQGAPFYPKVNGTDWTYTSVLEESAEGTKSKLVSKNDHNIKGFMQFNRTYLVSADASGTITGQKYSVPSKIRVQGVGILTLIQDSISMTDVTGGDISGTRASYKRTPAKASWQDVTMTLEITASPPAEAARAFDPTLVSCSLKEERLNLRGGPGTSVIFGTETNNQTVTGFNRACSASTRHEDLVGYYIAGDMTKAGELTYVAAEIPKVTDNTVSTSDEVTVKEQTSVVGTGDNNASAYATTGIVDQKARPVFITYDGTIYWEVIKWTAA